MIDTIGSGIRRTYRKQRERNFPMPDFDLNSPGVVRVRIIGKIIDENYTRMLVRRRDLDLLDIIALDKVQKRYPLTPDERRILKEKKLIEGRYPRIYVSKQLAAETDTKAEYIRKRSFDKQHFRDLIISYLKKYHEADRKEIDKLLMDKVSDVFDDSQKHLFIKNLLQHMRQDGIITTIGGKTRNAKWILTKQPQKEKRS